MFCVLCMSNSFFPSLDIQEFYEVTLEDASKPMTVKVEETRRLAEKWDKHGSVPIPVEAKCLAQRSIAPSSLVKTSCLPSLVYFSNACNKICVAYWISAKLVDHFLLACR